MSFMALMKLFSSLGELSFNLLFYTFFVKWSLLQWHPLRETYVSRSEQKKFTMRTKMEEHRPTKAELQ